MVDEEPALRAVLVRLLEQEGYQVQTAATGREAVAILKEAPPAILVLDLHLPDMSAAAVVETVHTHRLPSTILRLTETADARETAQRLHADGYVPKPVALLRFLRAVEHLCPAAAPVPDEIAA